MEEVIERFGCIKTEVVSTDAFDLSILKVAEPRDFMILALQTKRNCKQHETEDVFTAMADFIKNVPVNKPCYYFLDMTKTDAFTLGQLKHAALTLNSVRKDLETRLVGTVLKVDDDTYNDSYLGSMFRKLYTPVRPVCWWKKRGDAMRFIMEWEAKMGG